MVVVTALIRVANLNVVGLPYLCVFLVVGGGGASVGGGLVIGIVGVVVEYCCGWWQSGGCNCDGGNSGDNFC